jgi:hypothetical protein
MLQCGLASSSAAFFFALDLTHPLLVGKETAKKAVKNAFLGCLLPVIG